MCLKGEVSARIQLFSTSMQLLQLEEHEGSFGASSIELDSNAISVLVITSRNFMAICGLCSVTSTYVSGMLKKKKKHFRTCEFSFVHSCTACTQQSNG